MKGALHSHRVLRLYYAAGGNEVHVARGTGVASGFSDADYEAQGAVLSDDRVWREADVILKVAPPSADELAQMRARSALISFFKPHSNQDLLEFAAQRELSVLAMDCIPRISTAQSMDALSTMSNIAGYKAVIAAADMYGGVLAWADYFGGDAAIQPRCW